MVGAMTDPKSVLTCVAATKPGADGSVIMATLLTILNVNSHNETQICK